MLNVSPGPTFSYSPFYSFEEQLGPVHVCEGINPANRLFRARLTDG